MRKKRFLLAILLGVVLCFVSGVGYGEIIQLPQEANITGLDYFLLEARLNYVMSRPDSFLDVTFSYGSQLTVIELVLKLGEQGKERILVLIRDNRGIFYNKSGVVLLDEFKRALGVVYAFIMNIATDMNIDVVAIFLNWDFLPLGYFYQGEYHLLASEE